MSVTLDGQNIFDEQGLVILAGSYKRDYIEKPAPMLDGIVSIDLGQRSRIIKQTGSFRAKSRTALNKRILAVSDFMDGSTHMLVTGNNQYQNLRMDSFKITSEITDGTGIVADYEITYTQLT